MGGLQAEGGREGPVDGVSDPQGGREGEVDRHTGSLKEGWESWQMAGGGMEGWKGRWKHSWLCQIDARGTAGQMNRDWNAQEGRKNGSHRQTRTIDWTGA